LLRNRITGPTFTYSPQLQVRTRFKLQANTCSTTSTVAVITNPTVTIASQVNVSCNAGSDGSVTLIGSGGSGGYLYSNNPTTGLHLILLYKFSSRILYFYVRDNKVSKFSTSYYYTTSKCFSSNSDVVPFSCSLKCSNVSGTVTINVTAGTTPPYTYSFNGVLLPASMY
jgi:hypothetical protein